MSITEVVQRNQEKIENLKKNNNFIDENEEDFEFNQDIEFEEPIRSPGWLRYQKKLNDK